MPKIISTLFPPAMPEQAGEEPFVVETLGETEGRTYYSVPDDFYDAVMKVSQEDGVGLESHTEVFTVCKELSVYKQINSEVVAKIRDQYSLDEELKAIRTSDPAYATYVEKCVAYGNTKKVDLGLKPASVKPKKKKTKAENSPA